MPNAFILLITSVLLLQVMVKPWRPLLADVFRLDASGEVNRSQQPPFEEKETVTKVVGLV